MKVSRPQLAQLLGISQLTIERLEVGQMPTRKSTWALIEMWVIRNEPIREEVEIL